MTVVFPSSHSPMSSIEHPSAPRTPSPVAEASEVHDDNRGLSSDDESSQHEVVRDDSICEDFLGQHLRATPESFSLTQEMTAYVDEICAAGTSEPKIYRPAASLLTAISKAVYKSLHKEQKEAHRKRQHIRPTRPGHLTFIDHHSTAPTHFPESGVLSNVSDAPDILGAYDVDIFKGSKHAGVYKGVPHHRVEAIVEVKSEAKGEPEGRRQATTYAYRHHQARPDRPGLYVLVIRPQGYQVLYSDPTGVFASLQTPWTNINLLSAYIYSHYYPPTSHFLWDETVTWSEPGGLCTFPSWEIELNGQRYIRGEFIFVGDPWSRLTSTFDTVDDNGEHFIIKDCYRRDGRRFTEEDILEHLHAEGDLLGVVRLKSYESGLKFVLKGQAAERTRVRIALLDTGSRLLKAKTVNDLLKATYDALEVHRTKLVQRNVLHRDMSVYNILMYPIWGNVKGRQVHKNLPPTVQDVLSGHIRPVEDRFPTCLAIDYDNAARLDYDVTKPQELMQRTGTPMYISRSVCTGQVLTDFENRVFPPMPELSEDARKLYVSAHGQARYVRYNDTKLTRHGASPPGFDDFDQPRAFSHRPEHDVESVYWSMVSALLSVRPKGAEEEANESLPLQVNWNRLLTNIIPDEPSLYTDPRDHTLKQNEAVWRNLFLGDMKDVGTLLFNVSRQIRPEYALFTDDLQQDHLHEAAQRLILQYLVDHDDIPLDPDHLRLIPKAAQPVVTMPSTRISTNASGTGSGTKRATRGSSSRTSEDKGVGSATKRKSATRDAASELGGRAGSSSGARAAAIPNAIVLDPKRKSSRQTGRSSKRIRDNSGLPQSIEEDVEGDA